MYATINLPGSTHFEYYGPASKAECYAWLERRAARLLETQLLASTLPRRVVSNREVESWKYIDGSPVIRQSDIPNVTGCFCKNCSEDIPAEFSPRNFCPTCAMFCVVTASGEVKQVFYR